MNSSVFSKGLLKTQSANNHLLKLHVAGIYCFFKSKNMCTPLLSELYVHREREREKTCYSILDNVLMLQCMSYKDRDKASASKCLKFSLQNLHLYIS